MMYLFCITVSLLFGVICGIIRTMQSITKHTRRWVKITGHCFMCEDCPDGCPLRNPDDSRNIE